MHQSDTRLLILRSWKRSVAALIRKLPFGQSLLSLLKKSRGSCKRSALTLLKTGYGKRFVGLFNAAVRNSCRTQEALALGHKFLQRGQPEPALEQFSQAIRLGPDEVLGYLHRGRTLHQIGRLQEAHADFQAALALPPGRLDEAVLLHTCQAKLLVEMQDVEQAIFYEYRMLLLTRFGQVHGEQWQPMFIPDSAENFQVLFEAHDLLADHCIRERGDNRAALDIYRRKKRSQRRFADVYGLTNDRVLYLTEEWVVALGHLALLDFWVKMKHLGWGPWEQIILLAPRGLPANEAYLSFWKKHLTVVSDPFLVRALTPLVKTMGHRVNDPLELADGEARYFCEGMGVIQEEWENQGRAPLLELTPAERQFGRETLRQLGVPEKAWYVCVHARGPGFTNEGQSRQHAHRNADIFSYLPAMRRIVERGGWVVRLGDASMERLPGIPGLIDYAHSPLKSPWMDVFLLASCRFLIGVTSGPAHVPTTFGVPCVLTNWVSNPFPVNSRRDLFIPKLIWTNAENRFLHFEEILEPTVRSYSWCGAKLLERNLRTVDNTAEEILELVEEMCDSLDGCLVRTAEDERLQSEFRRLASRLSMVGFGRIGRAFLSKYAGLVSTQVESNRQVFAGKVVSLPLSA